MTTRIASHIALTLAMLVTATATGAAQDVIFKNEATDTIRLNEILIAEASAPDPGNMTRIAEYFIGTPYVGGTLEQDGEERLMVNLDEMDCTTFMETVAALAYTAREGRQSWQDFIYNLKRLRYRNGEIAGYPSRLHYMSAWVLDNSSRGNIKEVTSEADDVRYNVKSLNFMSLNRDKYAALADNDNFAGIKNLEAGFSNHRYPYLKGNTLKNKTLAKVARDGDIVLFTTATKGLDVSHVGIIKMDNGVARLMHASTKAHEVVIDPLTLAEYCVKNRTEGIRIVRLM